MRAVGIRRATVAECRLAYCAWAIADQDKGRNERIGVRSASGFTQLESSLTECGGQPRRGDEREPLDFGRLHSRVE